MNSDRRSDDSIHRSPVTIYFLLLIALATRLTAAFLLPNPEQDAYSYVEIITRLSANFGHLRLADLFGFWLPLFPMAAAIPNLWIDNPLLTGKILSALCGSTSCVLVFAISEKLTRNILLACAAFVLVLCNPLHLLYSAASMTDAPFGCLVLASLWFVLQKRWALAAILGALAEGVRLEAWTLIIVIPLVQLLWERRISLLPLLILLLPPLLWLGICQIATGDPFAYFAQRARYQANYLDFYPSRRGFALTDIRQDIEYFLFGANRIVFLSIVGASALSIFHAIRRPHRLCWPVVVTAVYAFALFGFFLLAYVTKRQPVIVPRYGLIFFILGLPLLVWLLDFKNSKESRWPKFVVVIVIGLCLWQSSPQLSVVRKVLGDFRAHRQVTDALVNELRQSRDGNVRCFSDAPSVRVLSHLPAGRFVRSDTAPPEAGKNRDAFESYLRDQHVAYLVFVRVEDSLPVKFFPELGRNAKIDMEGFQLITVAVSSFGPDVWLYRLVAAE